MILLTILIVAILLLFPWVLFMAATPAVLPSPVTEPEPVPIVSAAPAAANVLEDVGVWVQIDPLEGYEPDSLVFAQGQVSYSERDISFAYELDDSGTIEITQFGDAYLCDGLELQYVEVAGQTVPIVSLYMMEYDGRGLIIIDEFAPADSVDLFPEDYLSPKAQETRNRESSSMTPLGSMG